MRIIVCIKIINGALNPFDECALEEALRIENSEVTVVCMGPSSCADALGIVARLGVKRVVLISDKVFAGSDTLATSYILSCCIKQLGFDAVLCGRQSVDGDTAQVGPCLAVMLGATPITNVMKLTCTGDGFKCETRLGNAECTNPSLLTIERINTLRFPSIRSKAVGIEIWDNSRVGADVSRCGIKGSPTKVMKVFESERGRRKCKFITRDELIPLLDSLKAKKRKETAAPESATKLDAAWSIGSKVEGKAAAIARNVTVIDETNPHVIADMIREHKPKVVLWNADLEGRAKAPMVAAMLGTGLCADCTALETDGEHLFMYRPARSGNVIAKIRCDTLPQMATVRTDEHSDSVMVSGGKGIREKMDELKEFADKIGAELCASRGLVDMGLAPYSAQVGLTGKNVSPDVYIAVGISGAVHHTVGIENAGTVIAINPDKNARIFDYADYGIAEEF